MTCWRIVMMMIGAASLHGLTKTSSHPYLLLLQLARLRIHVTQSRVRTAGPHSLDSIY
jgi:hypothetical protein